MKGYKHIVLAVELENGEDGLPICRAVDLAKFSGAKLTLVHAVEQMIGYGAAYGITTGTDLEEVLLRDAEKMLASLGEKLSIPKDQQIYKIGPAKQVILDVAKELKADLIVMGSHGKHGVQLLLGSTATAVLHSAKCDVLAVRIPD